MKISHVVIEGRRYYSRGVAALRAGTLVDTTPICHLHLASCFSEAVSLADTLACRAASDGGVLLLVERPRGISARAERERFLARWFADQPGVVAAYRDVVAAGRPQDEPGRSFGDQ